MARCRTSLAMRRRWWLAPRRSRRQLMARRMHAARISSRRKAAGSRAAVRRTRLWARLRQDGGLGGCGLCRRSLRGRSLRSLRLSRSAQQPRVGGPARALQAILGRPVDRGLGLRRFLQRAISGAVPVGCRCRAMVGGLCRSGPRRSGRRSGDLHRSPWIRGGVAVRRCGAVGGGVAMRQARAIRLARGRRRCVVRSRSWRRCAGHGPEWLPARLGLGRRWRRRRGW